MQTTRSANVCPETQPPVFGSARAWFGYILVCGFLYWLDAARPLVAEPWQWADDGLFLQQGERIATWLCHPVGPWLGQYDSVLLAKPPGFGMWLALVHLAGVPLRVAEFALLLPLPFLFRRAVCPFVKLTGWKFLLVSILLVGMPSLAGELRLLRSGLQAATAGTTLIAALGITCRAFGSAKSRIQWAALSGISFACSYLNREESIWLLPAIAVALSICALAAWRSGTKRLILLPALVAFAVAEFCIGGICLLNRYHYGIFATSTRRGDQLIRLYETLTKLEPEKHERYIPVRTATRIRAYQCSPSFARLQSYLEGQEGDEFARNPTHNWINGRPPGTREFYGSNFQWALLRAAARAGAADAPAAERLFGAAANELENAIREQKITAGAGGVGFSNASVAGDKARLLHAVWQSAILLFTVAGVVPETTPVSSGSSEGLQRMSALTHTELAPIAEVGKIIQPPPLQEFKRLCFKVSTFFLRIAYPFSLAALAAGIARAALPGRRTRPALLVASGGLILLGSLFAFCVIIAVFDVLASPTLQWPEGYNRLGYIPLSVLAAYGVVTVIFVFSDPPAPTGTAICRY